MLAKVLAPLSIKQGHALSSCAGCLTGEKANTGMSDRRKIKLDGEERQNVEGEAREKEKLLWHIP